MPAVQGSVTVRRPGGWDDNGDPLPAADFEQPGCAWAPRSTTEITDLRETVVTGYWLFAPFDANIRSSDQILIPGVLDNEGAVAVWDVDGDVGRWDSPYTGRRVGSQIALRRASG